MNEIIIIITNSGVIISIMIIIITSSIIFNIMITISLVITIIAIYYSIFRIRVPVRLPKVLTGGGGGGGSWQCSSVVSA